MSIALTPQITQAGLQAVFNATNDGVQAKIKQVALGDIGWQPTSTATKLRRERNRVPVTNGERLQSTQIHITAVENGSREYWVREIGFYLDDGTLFAIWSHPTQALAWKAKDVDLLLAFDMLLSALPEDSVTIDGTGGVNLAPATEQKEGLVRLASTNEAKAGSLTTAVALTPAGNQAHGDARYAKLAHKHLWGDITGKPSTYPPATHNHDGRYIELADFKVTSGFVRTTNPYSKANWEGYNDWTKNYADISPPTGYRLSNLQGFIAGIGIVYFNGDVNEDDQIYLRWRKRNGKVRVICANSENRTDAQGSSSYINYLAIWRK